MACHFLFATYPLKSQAARVAAAVTGEVAVVPFVGAEVVALTADEESALMIAGGATLLDAGGTITAARVEARQGERVVTVEPAACDYLDAAPGQIVGLGAALIPFLEHDDPTRAQMGATMQRQAVPLLRPEAPLVGTGVEAAVARAAGWLVIADAAGTVVSATARAIVVEEAGGRRRHYPLRTVERTSQETCHQQRPLVRLAVMVPRVAEVMGPGRLAGQTRPPVVAALRYRSGPVAAGCCRSCGEPLPASTAAVDPALTRCRPCRMAAQAALVWVLEGVAGYSQPARSLA